MVDIEPQTAFKVIVNKGSDQGEIDFSSDIANYSKIFEGAPQKNEPCIIEDNEIKITDLKIINQFYVEIYKQNQTIIENHAGFKKKKISSEKLQDALPEPIIEFMQNQGWLKSEENNLVFDEFKARNTWDACMVLGFELMAEIFIQAFSSKYYCPDNEEGLKKWCKKYNQQENLYGQEMYNIRMGENKEIFDLIEEQEMKELEQLFEEEEKAEKQKLKNKEEEQKQNMQNQ